jgi:hypothetical protein
MHTLREGWTQSWFPTAVRDGYLRNVIGRFALATAVITPALRLAPDPWRERIEPCWISWVYLPGGLRLRRVVATPVAAAEAAYSLLSEPH